MSVTPENILQAASLARIDLSANLSKGEQEALLQNYALHCNTVLEAVEALSSMIPQDTEPLFFILDQPGAPRPDIAEQVRSPGQILANAPQKSGTFFVVPPVL